MPMYIRHLAARGPERPPETSRLAPAYSMPMGFVAPRRRRENCRGGWTGAPPTGTEMAPDFVFNAVFAVVLFLLLVPLAVLIDSLLPD